MRTVSSCLRLALLLIVTLLATSCSTAATPAPQPAQVAPTAAAEKKADNTPIAEKVITPAAKDQIQDGGTLNYAYPQAIRSFNMLNAPAGVQAEMFRLIFNRLVTFDVGAKGIIPELAESWSFSPDQKTITYKLRKDVKWHDGTPFTAKDVEFTYKAALWPKMTSTYANQLLTIVGAKDFREGKSKDLPGIKVVDDTTIEFTMEKPDAAIFLNSALISILPRHLLEKAPLDDANAFGQLEYFTKKPIGTGPFKVKNYVENQFIEFERNETYFRGKPHIEKINWMILASATVIPAGLEAGEIDITANTPYQDLERFTKNPNFSIYWQPTAVYCSLAPNFNRAYMTPKVLQGIAQAIDRQTLVKEFLGQTGQVWDNPLGHDWLYPNPDLKPYTYDLEKAKQLLKEGGWDFDKQSLDLYFGGTDTPDVVVFIADSLKKAGIKVEIKAAGTGAAQDKVYYLDQTFDLFWGCNSWGFDPDSTAIYYRTDSTFASGKGWNTGGWSDKRLDELYDLGRSTLDQAARKKYYQEAQSIFQNRLPKIVMYRSVRAWVIRNKVHDATPQYHGELPNYNAIEKWWISK